MTNLDGLDTVETIKVCIAYRAGSARLDYMPADSGLMARCQPVYAELPGWGAPTSHCRTWKDLPRRARGYLKALADLTGARLRLVSVGPARAQTIVV